MSPQLLAVRACSCTSAKPPVQALDVLQMRALHGGCWVHDLRWLLACGTCSRCRHAVAAVGPYVFIYGGLRGSALLEDFLLADDRTTRAGRSSPSATLAPTPGGRPPPYPVVHYEELACAPQPYVASRVYGGSGTINEAACRRQWLDTARGGSTAAAMLAEAAAEEAAAAAALGVRRVGAVEDLRCLDENLDGGLGRRWGFCCATYSSMPRRCCKKGER